MQIKITQKMFSGSRILICGLFLLAFYSFSAADSEYEEVFLDGPSYTIAELWEQVGLRSPYTVYIGVETPNDKRIVLRGLQPLEKLINITVNQLEQSTGKRIVVRRRNNNIQFLVHERKIAPKKVQPKPKRTRSSDDEMRSSPIMKLKRPSLDDFEQAPAPKNNLSVKRPSLDVEIVKPGHKPSQKVTKFVEVEQEIEKPTQDEKMKERTVGVHLYPKFRVSGIQGLAYMPSLKGLKSAYQGKFSVDFDTSYTVEEFSGYTRNSQMLVDGYVFRENIKVSRWIQGKTECSLELITGLHDSNAALSLNPGTAYLRTKELKYALADAVVGFRHLLTTNKLVIIPEAHFKIAIDGEEDIMSTGSTDASVGVELLREYQLTDVAFKVNYTYVGDMKIGRPGLAEINQKDIFSASLAVGHEVLKSAYTSFALNWAQNPTRDATDLDPLNDDIVNVSALFYSGLTEKVAIEFDATVGVSTSAPDFGLGMNILVSF